MMEKRKNLKILFNDEKLRIANYQLREVRINSFYFNTPKISKFKE